MKASKLRGPRGCSECFLQGKEDIFSEPSFYVRIGDKRRHTGSILCEKHAKELNRALTILLKERR